MPLISPTFEYLKSFQWQTSSTLALGPEEELETSFPGEPHSFLFPFTDGPAVCLLGLRFAAMSMRSLDNSQLGRFIALGHYSQT